MDDIGGMRTKRTWVAWPGYGPAPPGHIWDQVAPSRSSSSHTASHVKIFTPKKPRSILVPDGP
jgi:hypothetical protein